MELREIRPFCGLLQYVDEYCDVTAESRNSGATARRPLLSSGSEITTFSSERVVTR
jgi:hypothetical protein